MNPGIIKDRSSKRGLLTGSINLSALAHMPVFQRFSDQKLKKKNKQLFFSHLAMLISADVDLETVLRLAINVRMKGSRHNELYQKLVDGIAEGRTLADSMADTNKFNEFDITSVQIAESTGEYASVFGRLAEYYKKKITSERKIISTLTYPAIVLFIAMLSVGFMLKFVVPMFATTLQRFGGELPLITKAVIGLSNNLDIFLLSIVAMLTVVRVIFYVNRENFALKMAVSKMVTKVPFFGAFIYRMHLLQFTQAMHLLLSAKLDILESVRLAQQIVKFPSVNTSIANVKIALSRGSYFHEAIREEGIFDDSMNTLVRIGEEVNRLDKSFEQLSVQFESDLDYQSGLLMSWLEPMLLVFLSVAIGTVLVAMYLPMFKLGTAIH